jgi:hypothetical protein
MMVHRTGMVVVLAMARLKGAIMVLAAAVVTERQVALVHQGDEVMVVMQRVIQNSRIWYSVAVVVVPMTTLAIPLAVAVLVVA